MYEIWDCFKFDDIKIHGKIRKKSMIFWQLVSLARLFAQFHAGTKHFQFRTIFFSLKLSQ